MNTNKLKGKLVEKSVTYADCAKIIGVSVTTFSSKMNGTSKFYVEEAQALSEFLKLSNSDRVDIFLN